LSLSEEVKTFFNAPSKKGQLLVVSGTTPLFFYLLLEGGKIIARQKGKNRVYINEEIRFPKVRLIDSDGEMLGIKDTEEALDIALNQGMDLVLMSDNPDNPVAKVMDYGKYQFEQSKKAREAKKNQKKINVKEVQLKLTTEEHDFNVRVRNAHRFLANEDRVKVVIRFRGREMSYQNQGFEVMEKFADACRSLGKVDRKPIMEGRHMVMYLAPLSEKEKRELAEKEELAEDIEA
jgi:translation initiation factor IF-3